MGPAFRHRLSQSEDRWYVVSEPSRRIVAYGLTRDEADEIAQDHIEAHPEQRVHCKKIVRGVAS